MIKQLLTQNAARLAAQFRPKQEPVISDQLIHLIGLKRSGLHALAFWILAHQKSNMLLNNSPRKKPGNGSYMSRTDRESPLPIVVHLGDEVAVYRDKSEHFELLSTQVGLSIVVFQSQSLPHLASQTQLTTGIKAKTVRQILTLRDPFTWAASYMKKSQHPDDCLVWPGLWLEYANEFAGNTHHLPDAIKINYNQWFEDRAYRQQISPWLGFKFTDEALEIVTPHADGSSFDQTQFDAQAQKMAVTERWRHYQNEPKYRAAFQQNQDILELGTTLFDLSPDLQAFAQSCRH